MKALGDIPSSRDGHACTRLGEEMIIHGGFSADVRTLSLSLSLSPSLSLHPSFICAICLCIIIKFYLSCVYVQLDFLFSLGY